MSGLAYILQNLPFFILLLGALVFFHELGHFLFAKAFDFKVVRFAVGFGPSIFTFKRGETEYSLRALPLGGYVKMVGETPGQEIPPEDLPRAFSSKPLWQRALVVFAGPAFNLILAFVVYAVMFTGQHSFDDTRLGIVTPGDPAWSAGLRPGDKVVTVNGEPTTTWDELREAIGTRPGETLRVTYMRNGQEHAVTIKPTHREEMNLFQEIETRGKIGVSLQYVKPVVAVLDAESPAALAGVKSGDVVRKVNGKGVQAWHEIRAEVAAATADIDLEVQRGKETLSLRVTPGLLPEALGAAHQELFSSADAAAGYTGIVSQEVVIAEVEADTPAASVELLPGDRILAITVRRDGQALRKPVHTFSIDLRELSGVDARSDFDILVQRGRTSFTKTLRLVERVEKDEFKNEQKRFVFGAKNDAELVDEYTYLRTIGLPEALERATQRVGVDMSLIGLGVAKMVQGKVPLDTMGGPMMLFDIAAKSAERGWDVFFGIMAVISVQLGMLNLLPIPVLDGGHLVFFAFEAIRRRPPSLRFRELANVVGLALLMMLMLLAFKNDVFRYIIG